MLQLEVPKKLEEAAKDDARYDNIVRAAETLMREIERVVEIESHLHLCKQGIGAALYWVDWSRFYEEEDGGDSVA